MQQEQLQKASAETAKVALVDKELSEKQGPEVGARLEGSHLPTLCKALPEVVILQLLWWRTLTNPTLDSYHRARLSPWPSEPVCRRGKSPDRRLMGLRDWFFAVAAATGGCQ